MISYEIEVSATAEKQLKKLDKPDQVRVVKAIRTLSADPRPRGCRKLRGFADVFRIRVGTYRIIYSVEEERVTVIVLKIGHRSSVYR